MRDIVRGLTHARAQHSHLFAPLHSCAGTQTHARATANAQQRGLSRGGALAYRNIRSCPPWCDCVWGVRSSGISSRAGSQSTDSEPLRNGSSLRVMYLSVAVTCVAVKSYPFPATTLSIRSDTNTASHRSRWFQRFGTIPGSLDIYYAIYAR